MPKPTECRYCGCKEQRFGHFSDDHIKFKCGTVSCSNGIWSIGSKCYREILGQVVDMREQIKQLTAEKLALNDKLDKMWEEAHSRLSFDPRKKSTEG